MITDRVYDLVRDDVFLRVTGLGDLTRFYLKLEGLNAAGSIKLKTARSILTGAELSGVDMSQVRIIESTSGNLGVALAVICAAKGYRLTCVTDANANASAAAIMRTLGAEVVVIRERDENGGFLGSRISYIRRRLQKEPDLFWVNQYANPDNSLAHEQSTAPAVLDEFHKVDRLYVGVGTGGTLMGITDYFRTHSPQTRIVAVDSVGSVNFSSEPGPRHIPGLGTSRRPELLAPDAPDEVVLVHEDDTVRECRWLARTTGLLAGGSTGTVLAAIRRQAADIDPDETVVAIAPDLGERYLNSVYDDDWVIEHGLGRALAPERPLEEGQRDVLV
ncbi:2,3-diaminopropionate biosynthesis protein SbnA [Actinoalloteichus fjordicus]|uniref:2,3-diaminopropionate biosynthesis protein SbnA n=1 Tax=Actinoalloteichus fjordicus TaxID=1612552 RepID=A0AAC9LEM7_9PSEU|nr:2,3-diaminopropionate biosynthesis protein SbnA [Actinoalloteichus fjordicus]APU15459.1 2,3-diaminopropionate biosynthesis protein SbnA [Actinoalloteichus fjordicus]